MQFAWTVPSVRDRVVQTALRSVIEPIFEQDFAEHRYGFRPGRGCKDALRRVDALLRAGHTYVVDVDLQSYFDSIPWEPLMAGLRAKVADGRVLTLIESFLTQGVMDGLDDLSTPPKRVSTFWATTFRKASAGRGTRALSDSRTRFGPRLRASTGKAWISSSLAERFLCGAWVVQHGSSPCCAPSICSAVNHRLESRVRENRLHGSEGGEAGSTGLPYPYRLSRVSIDASVIAGRSPTYGAERMAWATCTASTV